MAQAPGPTDLPDLPLLYRVRQRFDRPRCDDIAGTITARFKAEGVHIEPGQSVAIAVGSRGIANLATAVKAVVEWVRSQQGEPFLVPAMGSHGGATGPGQQAVIEGYGVTETAMGAPIRSAMDVVELPAGDCPIPVYLDRHASQADWIIPVNRVKVHTDFHGPHESGLLKMLAIGLGKQAQAIAIHSHGVRGMRDLMPLVAKQVLAHAPVLAGVALVENAYDETAEAHVVPAALMPVRELDLIERARGMMPSLPLDQIHILVVDRMGKDVSGVGMDTNIIGRLLVDGQPEPQRPRIDLIVTRTLSEASHGNALGVGLADIVTRRLADAIDWPATYENIYTSTFLKRGYLPIVAETDAQALSFALRSTRGLPLDELRLLRIQDTLHVSEFHATQAAVDALRDRDGVDILGPVAPVFTPAGDLTPFHDQPDHPDQPAPHESPA